MPAISFYANFQDFDAAVSVASEGLRTFELSAKNVNGQLTRLAKSFDGSQITRDAVLAAAAIEKIGGASRLTEAEQRKVTSQVTEALAKYQALGQEAPAAIRKLETELKDLAAANQRAQSELQQTALAAQGIAGKVSGLGRLFGEVKTIAAGVFAGFGVTTAVQGLANIASQAVDTAGRLSDLSAQTGISASALDRMRRAAAPAGVEIETITNAVAAMSDKLVSGDKSAVGGLETLGLELDTLQRSKPEDAFLSIVDALAKIPDPMTRTKVAFDVLGGRAKEALRIVNDEFVQNARHGDSWSEDQIQALDDAGDAWGHLRDKAVLYSGQIIAGAFSSLDALQEAARGIGDVIDGRSGRAPAVGPWTGAGKPATIGAANLTQRADGTWLSPALPISTADQSKVTAALDAFRAKWKALGDTLRTEVKPAAAEVVDELDQAGWDAHVAALHRASEAYRQLAVMSAAAAQGLAAAAGTRQATYQMFAQGSLPGWTSGMPEGLGTPVWTPGVSVGLYSPTERTSPRVASFSDLYGWNATKGALPGQLLSVFSGGGDIGGGLGSLAGGLGGKALGGLFSTMASSGFLSAGLATTFGALGSAVPVIGTLLGGFLGKQLGGLFGPSRNAQLTQQANQGIAQTQSGLLQQYGSIGNIAGMNVAGAELAAAWGSRGVGGQEHFNRLVGEFNAMLAEQTRLTGEQDSITGQLLDKETERARLAASLVVPYSEVQRIAQEYGLTLAQMGGTIAQMGTTASFTKVINDLETLDRAAKQAGGELDWGGVLDGMSTKINGMVLEARKLGTALPENMRPYLEELVRAGKLTDENGQKITDLSGIKFGAPIETEAQKSVKAMDALDKTIADLKTAFDDIAQSLRDLLPAAARDGAAGVDAAFRNTRPRITVDVDYAPTGEPSSSGYGGSEPRMAQGGIVRYPTRAVIGESGPEAVIPLSGNALRDLVPQVSQFVGELRWRGQTIADVVWSETRDMAVARGLA